MPPQQHFTIPSHLYAELLPTSDKKVADALRDADGKHEYVFGGLEVHRSIYLPFYSFQARNRSASAFGDLVSPHGFRHTLKYTSIEAGQSGGRRSELTLLPATTSPHIAEGPEAIDSATETSAETPNLEEDFVKACYGLACSSWLWSGSGTAASS